MDISRLEEFMIIADEHSIKKAAQKLQISPATLSSRLNVFEKDLDTVLFIREHHTLSLTPEGQRLYHNAMEILDDYHHIVHQMQFVSANELNRLRIGFIGIELPFHIGPYLDIVNLRHPSIQIDILDDDSFSVEDALLSGELDICIGPLMHPFRHDEIIAQTVAPPHSNLILPFSHPLAQTENISMHQLEGETFLLYPKTKCPYIRDFQLANLKASLSHFKTYESQTCSQHLHYLVPVGKGILLTPYHSMPNVPRSISKRVIDLPHPAQDTILYLRNPAHKEIKDFVNDFMKFVKENNYPGH